jgi:hypothetical protein
MRTRISGPPAAVAALGLTLLAGPAAVADVIEGTPGNDEATVGTGDVVHLGSENDWAYAYVPGAVVHGGPGRDRVQVFAVGRFHFGPGPDLACGWAEDSADPPRGATFRYWLGAGDDVAFGSAGEYGDSDCYEAPDRGRDVVWAGPGDDRLRFVVAGRDRVYAGPGDDSIRVRNRDHRVVVCGPGHDVLTLVDGADPPVARGCEHVARVERE